MTDTHPNEHARAGIHILIAEDSPTQAEHLKYLLERNGFQVTVANNGRQVLEILEHTTPALIISDIVMPEMNGYELCHAIREDSRHAALPLMLVTSLSDVHDVLKGLESGADNFIRKPYDEKYLLARVDYLLMNRQMRQDRKMQMGMEIYLSGHKHFVNAERQQILDLLISTFEEAVRVKEDLEVRQQELLHAALFERTHGEILRLFNSTLDRSRNVQGMLDILGRNHAFPFSAVYAFDAWQGLFLQEAAYSIASGDAGQFALRDDALRRVSTSRQPLLLEGAELEKSWAEPASIRRPACLLLCPAVHLDKLMAIIAVASNHPLTEREQTFLERIAAQLGAALHNVQLYDDLKLLADQLRLRSEEIARQNGMLEEASRMKSEFLANMSHELRTPLNAIIGFSEVMRDGLVGDLSDQQREYINDIFESGQHLLYLINDVLDLSKIEAGKMVLDAEEIPVAPLLQSCLSIIREKAIAHRIQLSVDAPETLGTVWADARKVKQVVYNLLSNAVKFTPENGGITLKARHVPRQHVLDYSDARPETHTTLESTTDEFLEIAVSDTGIGIAADDLARLFQPFVQLDSSLSRRFDGTGLGLVMVRKLVDLHEGAVAVASEPGKGSTFTFWLPCRKGTLDSPAKSTAPVGGSVNEAPLVLIVEDENRAANILRLQLEQAGCRTIIAANAEMALDLLQRGCQPDLITLDILLPGMDGWDFLAHLKREADHAAIPVIILSIVADGNKGWSLGASDVLQKPVSSETLLSALRQLGFVQPDKAQVLVVDDDPRSVEIISTYLERAGFQVMRTYSGAEGLQVAESQLPDLIVLDLMMSGLSGFDIVKRLKSEPRTARIPIVVLTAGNLSTQDREALNGQVMQVLEKSQFNHGHFIEEVQRALGRTWQKS